MAPLPRTLYPMGHRSSLGPAPHAANFRTWGLVLYIVTPINRMPIATLGPNQLGCSAVWCKGRWVVQIEPIGMPINRRPVATLGPNELGCSDMLCKGRWSSCVLLKKKDGLLVSSKGISKHMLDEKYKKKGFQK